MHPCYAISLLAIISFALYYLVILAKTDSQIPRAPIRVTWNAKVLGCLTGCAGYSFENIDPKAENPYFHGYDGILDNRFLTLTDIVFQIKGRWASDDCSYKNSLFGRHCTPHIDIAEIEDVSKNLSDGFSEKIVRIGSKDYMFVQWKSSGNASANVEFSLWDLTPGSETFGSKSYSIWANFNFRKDQFYTDPCDGPRYSEGSNSGEVGKFLKDKISQFLKEEDWPKQCMEIISQ